MKRPPLTEEQRISWLRLSRSDKVGPITFHNLINRFGSADAALDALPEISARHTKGKKPAIFSHEEAERELENARRLGIRHIAYGEPDYPSLLREADGMPPILLVQGKLGLDTNPHIALVGSRNASIAGQKMAMNIARELSEEGHIVVSGLARGIDKAAHQAALQKGTVAVIAGGHAKLYPQENIPLAYEIVENGGAIISEMPPFFEPRGQDFPRRNRIISGLSLGICVVEAAKRSGSLITARLANEQGRQVFAVPGSPLDPRAEGTNHLIREGATLVRGGEDIINDLRHIVPLNEEDDTYGQEPFRLETVKDEDFNSEYIPQNAVEVILDGLSSSPVHQDDIIRFTDLPSSLIISSLCELEIAGRLIRHEGNLFSLAN